MSRQEARRRLQRADPNLTIVSGRRAPSGGKPLQAVPRVLSPEEAKQWGLPEMIPIFPTAEVLAIEALYSKKYLEELCLENYLESQGDKDRLITKLIYIGVMDAEGRLTDKAKVPVTSVPSLGSKFPLGMTVITAGVAARIEEDPAFGAYVGQCLQRHANGDWGDLSEEDKKENAYSLDKYLRLFSAYDKYPMPKIWIITEADRSVTTTLFPDEY